MFNINPLTYFLIFISFFSGRFKILILFLILIIVHECGHFLTAKFFNWKIDKIYIYPLGGITRFNEKINKPYIEEILVAIMGPVFQIIITILLSLLDKDVVILSKSLLLFNLLPILPLDGGRILNTLLSLISPYKKCLCFVVRISYVFYLVILYLSIKLSSYFFVLVLFFLLFKINEERKNIGMNYNKFLLERYLYRFRFNKTKIINNLDNMYKYKNNIIENDKRIYDEKEYIGNVLNKKNCK